MTRNTAARLARRLEKAIPPAPRSIVLDIVYVFPRDYGTRARLADHAGEAQEWRQAFPAWPEGRPDDSGDFDAWRAVNPPATADFYAGIRYEINGGKAVKIQGEKRK